MAHLPGQDRDAVSVKKDFKKLNCKKSGGIFVKLVDCVDYLVNLASTEYRSITEKFKGVFHKIDGLQNHFNKV